MNEQVERYRVAVAYPEVSGFEHLDMLLTRDRLGKLEETLTQEEKQVLAAADQRLLEQAAVFHAELSQITDLAHERHVRNATPDRWWWYLDVLAHLPASPQRRTAVTV